MKTVALSLSLLLAASMGLAQDMAELELDHNVNSEFVTPHTVWAKPYAPGKVRVLFFSYGRDVEAREAIELKQRFDFELQTVYWASIIDSDRQEWHGGERGIQRMARLLTQKWDAFVFMGPGPQLGVQAVSPELMPTDEQYTLLKAVTEGAGLVLIGVDDRRVLKEKNQLKELPAALRDVEGSRAFTIMQGRGVRLPVRPKITYRPGWEVEYDEWAMRVGKSILWAAGKGPTCSLTLQPNDKELPRATLPGPGVTLQWQGAGQATAELKLRREDGVTTPLPPQPLKTSEGSVALRIPTVRSGNYYLDVIAREGQNVVGFGSVPFAVVGERKVQAVALDRGWAEIGETLSGKVTLSGAAAPNERLIVSLLDRRGREIARQVAKTNTAEPQFRFDIQAWFPMLLEVRATLADGTGEVASAWQFARVVKRNRGQFNFVIWDTPRGNLTPWAEQALANTGVTVHLSGSSNAEPPFAAYEMAWIPYTTHLGAACQPACWADETKIQAHVDEIVNKHIPTRQHGVFVYSLGDEIVVRGSCTSPQCLDAYRKYLQEQYGDIAALNASWGTNYSAFDDVQLSKPDDNNEAEAMRAGNFPRWFDRQAYQSYNFCKLCERFGKGFRRIDPESHCGFEGAGTFGAADDLDGFVRSNTFWSPYPGTADEVLRSIAPRDFPHSNWMGYTKDADTLLEKYWRMVTRGCDSVWWWRWEALGRFHGWLSPSLDPYPAVKEILRDTQIVRDGLGDLLLNSEMQTDGIGILYSLPSAYAAKVQVSPTYGSCESNHAAFHNTLRDMGYNFLYFTDRQMRLGEVDLKKFKVILLPMTQALGAQEAEMLRTYVREGGLLIADVRPAIYDGHVKPLATGQLDDVFGVKRTGFPDALLSDGVLKVPSAGGKLEAMTLTKVRADGGVQAAGASAAGAAGETPLFLSNEFGRGRAVLLNMAMSTFTSLGSEPSPDAAARLWRQILGQGQVSPVLDLSDAQGRRMRNVEVTRWMNGPVQIVSVFRHHGAPEAAKLNLPQPLYVYDMKARKNLGKRQAVNLTVTPYRAMFFAFSPQPLKPVELKAKATVSLGGVQRVTVTSSLPQGRQAVKVEVKQPSGKPADWISPVVVVGLKGATVNVPVAFNDPRGTWTATATELYTGKTTSMKFRVE